MRVWLIEINKASIGISTKLQTDLSGGASSLSDVTTVYVEENDFCDCHLYTVSALTTCNR